MLILLVITVVDSGGGILVESLKIGLYGKKYFGTYPTDIAPIVSP